MDAVFAVNYQADKGSYLNCVSMSLFISELNLRAIDTYDGFDGDYLDTLHYVLKREVRCDKFVIVTIPDTHSGDFELGVLAGIEGFVGTLHKPLAGLSLSELRDSAAVIHGIRSLRQRISHPKTSYMRLILQLARSMSADLTPEEKQDLYSFGHRTQEQNRALLENYFIRVKNDDLAYAPRLICRYRKRK